MTINVTNELQTTCKLSSFNAFVSVRIGLVHHHPPAENPSP